MAEPIIIVKEGSLTVQVRKRSGGKSTTLLEVTVPGNIKFPANSRPKGTKTDDGWKITWKKEPVTRRRRRRG